MNFVSNVNPDEKPTPCYELKIEAVNAKDGKTVEVSGKWPVTDFFDTLGYCLGHTPR